MQKFTSHQHVVSQLFSLVSIGGCQTTSGDTRKSLLLADMQSENTLTEKPQSVVFALEVFVHLKPKRESVLINEYKSVFTFEQTSCLKHKMLCFGACLCCFFSSRDARLC